MTATSPEKDSQPANEAISHHVSRVPILIAFSIAVVLIVGILAGYLVQQKRFAAEQAELRTQVDVLRGQLQAMQEIPSTSVPSPTPLALEASPSPAPLIYRNTNLGFTLRLSSDWSEYKAVESSADPEAGILGGVTLYMPTKVESFWRYREESLGNEYVPVATITLYTKQRWEELQASSEGGSRSAFIAKRGDIVATYFGVQNRPADISVGDSAEVINSFAFSD